MASGVRSAVLGVTLVAVGFLVGLGYSMVAVPTDDGLGTPKIAETIALRGMQHVRGTLDEEIPALRSDVAELRRALGALAARLQSAGGGQLPPGSRELYHMTTIAADGGPSPYVRDAAYTADAPKLENLQELEKWRATPDLRRKWLFTGERDIVRAFGAPDEIHPDAGGEWWIYWKKAGAEKPTWKYSLHISAGRLVDASYFEDPDAKKGR